MTLLAFSHNQTGPMLILSSIDGYILRFECVYSAYVCVSIANRQTCAIIYMNPHLIFVLFALLSFFHIYSDDLIVLGDFCSVSLCCHFCLSFFIGVVKIVNVCIGQSISFEGDRKLKKMLKKF